jgi:hypothetical protein
MNKTLNLQKEKSPFSMVDQHSRGVPINKLASKGTESGPGEKSRIQVCVETSNAERLAGMNVSYENSFNAIKKDILRETVDKKRQAALTKEVIPIEEKPNKPKEKLIVKNMNHHQNNPRELNMTQEVKNSIQIAVSNTPTITVDDILNRPGQQYASQRSSGKVPANQHQPSSSMGFNEYKNSTQP